MRRYQLYYNVTSKLVDENVEEIDFDQPCDLVGVSLPIEQLAILETVPDR